MHEGSYDGSGVSDCSNQLVAIGVTRSRANNACSYAHMTEEANPDRRP